MTRPRFFAVHDTPGAGELVTVKHSLRAAHQWLQAMVGPGKPILKLEDGAETSATHYHHTRGRCWIERAGRMRLRDRQDAGR